MIEKIKEEDTIGMSMGWDKSLLCLPFFTIIVSMNFVSGKAVNSPAKLERPDSAGLLESLTLFRHIQYFLYQPSVVCPCFPVMLDDEALLLCQVDGIRGFYLHGWSLRSPALIDDALFVAGLIYKVI